MLTTADRRIPGRTASRGVLGGLHLAEDGLDDRLALRVDRPSLSSAEAAAVVARIEQGGGTAIAVEADVSELGQVHEMVAATEAALGPLDVLVNTANARRTGSRSKPPRSRSAPGSPRSSDGVLASAAHETRNGVGWN